jgi:hypothetical protein
LLTGRVLGELGLVGLGAVSLVAKRSSLWVRIGDHGALGKSLAGQQGGGSEAELNDKFAAIRHGKNPQGLKNETSICTKNAFSLTSVDQLRQVFHTL